jgi:hypothetical protein
VSILDVLQPPASSVVRIKAAKGSERGIVKAPRWSEEAIGGLQSLLASLDIREVKSRIFDGSDY